MKLNIAINGFGRIGKISLRIIEELRTQGLDIRIVAINSPSTSPEHISYLMKYDSVFKNSFVNSINIISENDNDYIELNNNKIKIIRCYDLKQINWEEIGAQFIIESSGAYRTLEKAKMHIQQGAKKVIISAPSDAPTFIYGVNHHDYDKDMDVISNASCTTNCLAPLIKVLNDNFIVEEALVSSVHSSTASQNVVDGNSKKDWRLGRSTLNNIIPTATGAAKAVSQVLPELKGKITGLAYRIPTINGSLIDLTVRLKKSTNYNNIMKTIKSNDLCETIKVSDDPIVSSDIIGEKYSCVVDSIGGIELNEHFYKILAWYDNEYGYTSRMIDMLIYISQMQ